MLSSCLSKTSTRRTANKCFLEGTFGVKKTSSGAVSRLIKEAVNKNLIKPLDPNTVPRYIKYIPNWA